MSGWTSKILQFHTDQTTPTHEPVDAVVYRGPATTTGCPEAAAAAVRAAGLRVDYIGPSERRRLDARGLAGVRLYVQPGGGVLEDAWPHLKAAKHLLRDFVEGGGRYVGFCLGAYLAGEGPGFRLLPGDTDQYITSKKASVRHDSDAIVTVTWNDEQRPLYFQDGPVILLDKKADAQIVARYDNGLPAAAICRVGAGAVGVVGPHPEASDDWFTDVGLPLPTRDGLDLAVDLIRRTVAA